MKTSELISELANLPTEQRAVIADSLLQSLNPPQADIEQAWVRLAQQRLAQMNSSDIQSITAEDVFAEIDKRFSI